MDSEEDVLSSSNDLKDYFYRLELPEQLRSLFGLRPVELQYVDHPEARKLLALGRTGVTPGVDEVRGRFGATAGGDRGGSWWSSPGFVSAHCQGQWILGEESTRRQRDGRTTAI